VSSYTTSPLWSLHGVAGQLFFYILTHSIFNYQVEWDSIFYALKGKAVPPHAMKALGGDEI
jgi:hypothetical protein